MSYSGAGQAKQARELLGNALATLQQDATIPPQVGSVVSYMAQAVGSLFAAEYAQSNADGRAAVRAALGLLGQAIAAIQQIQHPAVVMATQALAQAMGILFPLTTVPDTLQPAPAPFLAQPAPAPEPEPQFVAPAPAHAPEPAKPAAKQTLVMATLPSQNELLALHRQAREASTGPDPTPHGFSAAQAAPEPAVHVQHVAQPAPQPQPQPAPRSLELAEPPVQPSAGGFQAPPASFGGAPEPAFQAPPASFAQPAAQPAQPQPAFQPTPAALAPAPAPAQEPFTIAATIPAPHPSQMDAAMPSPQAPAPRGPQPQPQPTPAQAPIAPMSAEQIRAANASIAAAQREGRKTVEANVGLTTETNFWVGFDDDIAHGGVFLPTYEPLPAGTHVMLQVTLPAGGMFACPAHVRYVRESLEYSSEMQPGMGLQFDALLPEHRDLAQRFMQKRAALFYDEA